MATPLNVIALISGGKDSLFSMLHCLANGHKVIALANLHPSTLENEDIDSYMYQTVGHTTIPLYESALGIPLYRQPISGSAVAHARDYTQQDDDETESLIPLLMKVKAAHPDANAVSTGAILSTYQRTRVENVAIRLGLTPLSYLWQYPFLPPYLQSSLLTDMHAVGQDARIIKVASGGMDESFLWEDVAEPTTVARMKKAVGRFSESSDGALLGEGGEFETLAIGGPSVLWKGRIVMEEGEVVRQGAGAAMWKAKAAKVVEKEEDRFSLSELRKPRIFDDEFLRLLDAPLDTSGRLASLTSPGGDGPATPTPLPTSRHWKHGNTHVFNNITGETVPGIASDIKTQFTNILLRLNELLTFSHTSKQSITHCMLLLRDMTDFTLINTLYATFFDFTNPPSRVTVAVGDAMQNPSSIMLSAIAHVDCERRGLHVQSHSYWAPANIGPYSHAISTPVVVESGDARLGYEVHIAGQIPLEPASMTLYTRDGFKGEALLALQHLFRIGRSQNVRWWTAGVAVIPSSADAETRGERVSLAQRIWKAVHDARLFERDEDAEVVDVWDRKNVAKAFDDAVERSPLPDYEGFGEGAQRVPPCFVVEVEALPRYASVEWVSTGLTVPSSRSRYCAVEIPGKKEGLEFWKSVRNVKYATLYYSPGFERGDWMLEGVSWVPCKRVYGKDGGEVRAVLVGRLQEA